MRTQADTIEGQKYSFGRSLLRILGLVIVNLALMFGIWKGANYVYQRAVVIPFHNVRGLNRGELEYGPDGKLRKVNPEQQYNERKEMYRRFREAYEKSHSDRQ